MTKAGAQVADTLWTDDHTDAVKRDGRVTGDLGHEVADKWDELFMTFGHNDGRKWG